MAWKKDSVDITDRSKTMRSTSDTGSKLYSAGDAITVYQTMQNRVVEH